MNMAVSKNTKVPLLVGLCAFSGVLSLQWEPSSPSSGVTLWACVGHDVNIAWDYIPGPDERVIDVEYLFKGIGQQEVTLASYIRGNFLVDPASVQHVTFLSPAGLHLVGMTSRDTGVYVIRVNVNVHNSVVSYTTNVTLQVAELPEVSDGRLQASLLDDVRYDNSSGQWHAAIACGRFATTGQPPVNVVVMTPDNQTLSGDYDNSGQYVALLPNPVVTGHYKCQLDNTLINCLSPHSPLLTPAVVNVDSTQTQLSVALAELHALKAGQQQCQADLYKEREVISNSSSQLQQCQADLYKEREVISNSSSQLQQCHADLQQKTTQLSNCFTHHPWDCSDVKRYDAASGVHTLYVNDLDFTAYCDQTTDGGRWTVFVNRKDGSVDFNRNWQPYEDGFGDKHGEYWLGLRNLHALTNGSRQYELRVDIGDWDGSTAYAVYDVFRVDGPDVSYVLHVTGYHGTAGDSLYQPSDMQHQASNNMPFSTPDRERNGCASNQHLGWWTNECFYASPTGLYNNPSRYGMEWHEWKNDFRSYKTMSLKIRPHTRN